MTRVLLTSDIHIGRSSSRIGGDVDRELLRAASAWGRIVDLAIAEEVELVCLGGDIADKDNKFFEAVGPLGAGIRRLAEAGIYTLAVAGNHDFDVLPKLEESLSSPHFKMLGRNGKWERFRLNDASGNAKLYVDGWSFPSRYYREDPVGGYPAEWQSQSGIPVLGMVHGDIYDSGSVYAPLGKARLGTKLVDGWHLGHIHAPDLITIEGGGWALYPGSPQAMSPGEPGVHGVWMVEIDGSQMSRPEQIPLSSVRYESLTIDISDVASEEELKPALFRAIKLGAQEICGESGGELAHLQFRIEVVGDSPVADRVSEAGREILNDFVYHAGDVAVSVEKFWNRSMLAVNLDDYLERKSAPGAISRLMRSLDTGELSEPEVEKLLENIRTAMRQVDNAADFQLLEEPGGGGTDTGHAQTAGNPAMNNEVVYLKNTARSLITHLVRQKS